jgi:hypothetical protein
MRHIAATLFLLAVCLTATAQDAVPAQQQLTQIPPKPTCNPAALAMFGGGPDCQDRWNIYNQAVLERQREELQMYVNRQKDVATAQATAPLLQQIKKLQEQMQADASAALQARADAHKDGVLQGAVMGVLASLVLVGLIVGIRLMTGSGKPRARAASV